MSSLSSPRAPSRFLPWDDEDEPTKRSVRSRRPPPPTRRQYKSGERARVKDTLVDMDHAPATERDAPRTVSSPRHAPDASDASDDPTAGFRPVSASWSFVSVEDAQPASEVRPAASRPGDDDFDHRATTKRPVAPVEPDDGPISYPIALRSNASQPASAPPPPPEPLHARSAHMPLVSTTPELNHLRSEVGRLRFRLLFTTVVAAVTLTSTLVLALLTVWPSFHTPSKPPPAARSATLSSLPKLALPDAPTIALPAVPDVAGVPAPLAVPEGRVEVVITLLTPNASVVLTRFGEMPQQVSGPWPVTLHLEPGKYTLTGSRMGKRPIMRMLDLSLDRPRREVTLAVH